MQERHFIVAVSRVSGGKPPGPQGALATEVARIAAMRADAAAHGPSPNRTEFLVCGVRRSVVLLTGRPGVRASAHMLIAARERAFTSNRGSRTEQLAAPAVTTALVTFFGASSR